MKDNKEIVRKLSLFEKLKKERNYINTGLQEISDLVLTTGMQFFIDNGIPMLPQGIDVYNTTARTSNKNLAATIYRNLSSRSSNWFLLNTSNERLRKNVNVLQYLEYASKRILQHLNSPAYKFPVANKEALQQCTALGTSAFRMVELSNGFPMYQSVPLNRLYLMENGFGELDTTICLYKYTLRQALSFFKREELAETTLKALEADPTRTFDIIHVVEPLDLDERSKTKFKYKSTYIDCLASEEISSGYTYQNDYIGFRFDKEVGVTYGSSPGWVILPDVRTANLMSKEKLTVIQLQIKPPIATMNDGILPPFRLEPNLFVPGGLDIATGDFRAKPMMLGGNIDAAILSIADLEKNIRDAFFADPFLNRDGPALTATEVVQIRDQSLTNIAPYIARIESEGYNRIVLQTFETLLRNQKLPPLPEGLSFDELEIEYTSPLSKLAKMEDGNSIVRFTSLIGPFLQTQPELLSQINMDRLFKLGVEASGLPMSINNTEAEQAAIDQQRADQQAVQQNMMLAEQMSKIKPPSE